MTTEPKFIPEEAVTLQVDENMKFRVRLIDCVGYIVPSSLGYIENGSPRMVKTPWFNKEIPFNMAAEMGTKKVITEHSTIGLVITSDVRCEGYGSERMESSFAERHDAKEWTVHNRESYILKSIICFAKNNLAKLILDFEFWKV